MGGQTSSLAQEVMRSFIESQFLLLGSPLRPMSVGNRGNGPSVITEASQSLFFSPPTSFFETKCKESHQLSCYCYVWEDSVKAEISVF